MKKTIQHNKPALGKEEIRAVFSIISSGWIASGKETEKFENEFGGYLGYKKGQAAAVSNGTAALYVSLMALGIKPGDQVIVPAYVCSAVLNAVFLAKAKPVLADINKDDLNISYEEVRKKITSKTKAIIVSHTFGMPADIGRLLKLRIPIIEDCAQALGSKINGKYAGTFGKIATFSFYASKLMTTGYGGMILSKDKAVMKKIKDYLQFDCRKDYKPRFNFLMSDIQAAMGRAQLKKLSGFLKKRKQIADIYYKSFPQDKVWPPKEKGKQPNFFRFLVKSGNPSKIKKYLESRGIKTIIPIETYELLHRYLKENPGQFPASEWASKNLLSIPVYPSLGFSEVGKIKKETGKILN
ncbi:MAG: DegT/DnrJ/EryC1/StrS family aminotransferase [Candidatus Pacebacteria bacterium]|nr:DegT/DnrJ/EryC1/StrS family aminotransferase [Candidatus Paceibacterota bacterium]